MNILIINKKDSVSIPGVSVFSCNADGIADNVFSTIANDDGLAVVPVTDFEYLAFRSIGYTTRLYKNGEVPEIVELSEATELLDTVNITAEPEAAAMSWGAIIGIIAAITVIGLVVTYLKNQTIKK